MDQAVNAGQDVDSNNPLVHGGYQNVHSFSALSLPSGTAILPFNHRRLASNLH